MDYDNGISEVAENEWLMMRSRSESLDLVIDILPWIVFWNVLYWLAMFCSFQFSTTFRNLSSSGLKSFWGASIVSTAHAIYIVYLSLVANRTIDVLNSSDFFRTSSESYHCNLVFMGYLCSDLILMLMYQKGMPGNVEMAIHHVTVVVCWFIFTRDKFGYSYGLIGNLCEATTPFVNLRFFLDKAGMKNSSIYLINGIMMTVLWFLLRVVLVAWVGFRFYAMRKQIFSLPPLHISTMVLLYVVGFSLQLLWFRKIVKGALKALAGSRHSKPNRTCESPQTGGTKVKPERKKA